MESNVMEALSRLPSPCYVIDKDALERNLTILKELQEDTHCRVLLAQKAFSCYPLYPWMGEYLAGTAASGLYEARLGKEEMRGESHVFCGAYGEEEIRELVNYGDHFVFNSVHQLRKYGPFLKERGKALGLRINPECSTQEGHEIYDPCAPGSRLGVTLEAYRRSMTPDVEALLDGVHFHTLCEQDADDLKTTLDAVEERFGWLLEKETIRWINFGGGHHVTRENYKLPLLRECIRHVREKYGLEVYLEPGEAVALNAGYLVTRVLDVVENGMRIAILDSSAACHMPDVIEMPYVPPLEGAGAPGERAWDYRLGGPTCLSGDVIGDYSFDRELREGDVLVFQDMAIYTMVKNNTFNGMPLPSIYLMEKGQCRLLKSFGYEDFKERLG